MDGGIWNIYNSKKLGWERFVYMIDKGLVFWVCKDILEIDSKMINK